MKTAQGRQKTTSRWSGREPVSAWTDAQPQGGDSQTSALFPLTLRLRTGGPGSSVLLPGNPRLSVADQAAPLPKICGKVPCWVLGPRVI